MDEITSRDGDMVDDIAWRHYRHRNGTAEAIYAANPDLAAYGTRLPFGIVILLPDLPAPAQRRRVRLWGSA